MAYDGIVSTRTINASNDLVAALGGIQYEDIMAGKGLALEAGDIVARNDAALLESDDNSKLSSFAITAGETFANFPDGSGFWTLEVASASATFEMFSDIDKAAGDKIASGTISATSGTINFTEENSSGVAGSVVLASGGSDDDDDDNRVITQFINYSKLDASSYSNKTVRGVCNEYNSTTGELMLIVGNAAVNASELNATNFTGENKQVALEKLQQIGIYTK